MATPTCPDCSAPMEGGFLLDVTHGGSAQTSWVDGAPEPNIWTGLKLKGHRKLPVYAWRCPRCTLIRLYAPDAG